MANPWQASEVAWPIDLAATVQHYGAGREMAWLDTAASDDRSPRHARYSLVCTDPLGVIEQRPGERAVWRVGGAVGDEADDAWALWRRWHGKLAPRPLSPFDLAPGWAGYIGFEMVHALERLPRRPRAAAMLPDMRMALFERGIVLDHRERRAFAVEAPGLRAELGVASAGAGPDARDWAARWDAWATARAVYPSPQPGRLTADLERDAFEACVRRAREYITAGDIYQVNLAQRFEIHGVADAFPAYAAIRRTNPEPYAALLRWEGGAVASASPELFLWRRADEVLTRPIKGTRPRTHEPEADEIAVADLLASPKDAAELAMIVDLHRNDLSRVCGPGSVQVLNARRVEAHPSVFHTVADIAGRLAPGAGAIELLTACFPAGSVTGVPKIRALEIIDELEPVARGAYTGAIGALGLDGQLNVSVAIRTLQIYGDTAALYVGGGIVAESDPGAEYEETLSKAAGILRALGHRDGAAGAARGRVGVH